MAKMAKRAKDFLTCGNCGGGVELMHDESGIWFRCPRCIARVAGPYDDAKDIPDYKPATKRKAGARKKKETPHQIRTRRLETLQAVLADAFDAVGWEDTDLDKLESWISVDDNLSDREWINAAKEQIVDNSVYPEHAGAPPPNVYKWNDEFISTYRMNIDDGMSEQEAIDSARWNANDAVKLSVEEQSMVKSDPKLYEKRRR